MQPISSICLNITDDCCLQCVYCFVKQQPNYMPYSIAKQAVDWLIKTNVSKKPTTISFFGGEPLLCWDSIIKPLTYYIRKVLQRNDIVLSITTNGILLDEDKLKFMKKYNIPLLLSMDGDRISQTLNRPCKNKALNSFDILNSKIDLILKYFPNTVFRSTITPNTAKYYSSNLNYAFQKGFQHSFFIVNAFEHWNEESKNQLKKEARIYSDFLIQSFINNTPIIRQHALEQIINRLVLNNILIAQDKYTRKEFEDNQAPCGSGQTGHVAINYEGKIFSCQELPSQINTNDSPFVIGNIYQGIDENKLNNLNCILCQKRNIKNNFCQNCLVEATCNINSCRINNYLINNNPYYQSDIACWWENLLAQESIYICNFLGTLKNEGFKEYFHHILTTNMGCLI